MSRRLLGPITIVAPTLLGVVGGRCTAMPLAMVEAPTFRKIFEPFNKKASEITNLNHHTICEEAMTMGRYA